MMAWLSIGPIGYKILFLRPETCILRGRKAYFQHDTGQNSLVVRVWCGTLYGYAGASYSKSRVVKTRPNFPV